MAKFLALLSAVLLSHPSLGGTADGDLKKSVDAFMRADYATCIRTLAPGGSKHSHTKPSNFGQTVSAEAHKLKADGQNKQKKFGKWVSSQRAQDDQRGSNSSGTASSDESAEPGMGAGLGAGNNGAHNGSSNPGVGHGGSHRPGGGN